MRERCRPGSARYLSGDAGMFIRHVGGTFMPRFCIFFADGYFCVGACSQGISELKDKEDISSVCMFNALEMELYIHGFGRAFYNCQTMRMSVLLSISYLLV